MAAQEALQRLVEREARVTARDQDRTRTKQESGAARADVDRAEMAPVDLGLFPRERVQAQIGFGPGRGRTVRT